MCVQLRAVLHDDAYEDGGAHSIPLPFGIDTMHLVSHRAALLEHLPVLPAATCYDEIPEALSEC